jgi:hypothetical protein
MVLMLIKNLEKILLIDENLLNKINSLLDEKANVKYNSKIAIIISPTYIYIVIMIKF